FADAALGIGQSFTDEASGVTLRLDALDPAGATVTVTLGGVNSTCLRANPAVSISGQAQAAPAGMPVAYAVSVQNLDSAACNTTSFALAATVPAGWFANFAHPGITLAPGQMGTTVLNVTSAQGTANGIYPVSVTVTNTASPTFATPTATSYQVANPRSTSSGFFDQSISSTGTNQPPAQPEPPPAEPPPSNPPPTSPPPPPSTGFWDQGIRIPGSAQ
ncbi:MAG: NEW3 domain-containing protein, partial [Candidatus Korobacteraceae bacterium]